MPIRKKAEGEVFAILAEHLGTMTTAAKVHFDEFWAVDGAAWEHLAYVFAILDGYGAQTVLLVKRNRENLT